MGLLLGFLEFLSHLCPQCDVFFSLGLSVLMSDVFYYSPYSLKPTLLGLPTNRLEPPSVSDGGDVSPVGLGAGLSTGEPVSPSDTPTEENLERDR